MYPYFTFFHWTVPSYLVITNLAYIPSTIYFYYAGRKYGHASRLQLVVFIVVLYFFQWIAGAMLPAIYSWVRYGPPPLSRLISQGRYYHSGLLFTLLFLIIYSKAARWPVKRFIDIFTTAAAIMSAFGRIGCLLQGCCSGKPCPLPWAIQFPGHPEAVHPTQLYHLIVEGLILVPILFYIQKHKKFEGQTFWTYALLYSAFRFAVEFFRTNPVAFAGMTHAQLFSLLVIPVSAYVLAKNLRRPQGS